MPLSHVVENTTIELSQPTSTANESQLSRVQGARCKQEYLAEAGNQPGQFKVKAMLRTGLPSSPRPSSRSVAATPNQRLRQD